MKSDNNSSPNNLKGMHIGCYHELSREIYLQEGIDYDARHAELSKDYLNKLTLKEDSKNSSSPIPLISHRIYFFSSNKDHAMDQISIDKTILTIEGLNRLFLKPDSGMEFEEESEYSSNSTGNLSTEIGLEKNSNKENNNWEHIFWTNNPANIPESITKLPNVIVKKFDEFEDSILWENLIELINSEGSDKKAFSKASDLLRYMVLNQHGGVYFDTDYHLLSPEDLLSLMNRFSFIGGKEFDKEMSYMGSAFVASIPHHMVIKTVIEQIYRNLNTEISLLPEYLQHPCADFSKIMYQEGPAALTVAFYKAANPDTDFMALNGNIFYNEKYVQSITPNNIHPKPDKPIDPVNNINGTLVNSIGGDSWLHPWPNEYFSYTYYPEYLNDYLYASVASNSIDRITYYLGLKADVNALNSEGNTPLKAAVNNKNIAAIRLLVQANATITEEIRQEAAKNKDPKIMQALFKDSKIDSLGCYANHIEEIFGQEGFDYFKEEKKLKEHYQQAIENIDHYIETNKSPIPFKTTQVYLTSQASPKPINEVSLNNTISSLELLNETNENWEHIFWTNNLDIIPESIKNIKNVQIRLIDEFSNHPLWNNIQNILKEAESKKYLYAMAADIIRLLAIDLEGGIYRDLDNKIHPDPDETQKLARVETLIKYMKAFNFIGGREHNKDLSFIGNAFFASTKNHNIITSALDYIVRNLNTDTLLLPEYVQYPCNTAVKVIYDTGSPTITSSYYGKGNQDGNVDVIFPTNVFFNVEYARSLDPKSRCHHLAGDAKLDAVIDGEVIKSIASDPNCGDWQMIIAIHYPHLINPRFYAAAETGDIKLLEELLEYKPDINFVGANGANPLGIAASKGHILIVKKLLALGAKTEIPSAGHTPLYWAIQEQYHEIAHLLINNGANVNAAQINNVSILYLACTRKSLSIIKLLLQKGANINVGTTEFTPEEFAKINNFTEITQIFLDYRLFKAAIEGNDLEVSKLIKLGADVNSIHVDNATPLHMAVNNNHPSTVKLLLENKANINSINSKGSTPLYISAAAGNTEITEILLEAEANTELKTGDITPLVVAAHFERVEDVKLLLKYNAQIISEDVYTAFNVFAKKQVKTEKGDIIYNIILDHYLNSKEIIEPSFEVVIARYNENIDWAIKEFGHNSNVKVTIYNKGEDDLDLANLPKHFQVVKLANVGREAHTYLHHIITNYYNLADTVLFLQGHPYEHPVYLPLRTYKDKHTSNCKNIIAKCHDGQPTLLDKSKDLENQLNTKYKNQAFPYNFIEYVQKFINPNISPNFSLNSVNGAQFAVKKENILSHSVSYYAKIIGPLYVDKNPLEGFYNERLWDLIFDPISELEMFSESFQGNLDAVSKFLDAGVDPNQKFVAGLTALHAAASGNHVEVIKLLLKRGASINLTSDQGLSPLFVAVNKNCLQAAKILLENKADPNLIINKESLVDLATRLGNQEMVNLLTASTQEPENNPHPDLFAAAFYGDLKAVNLFLDSNVNPNQKFVAGLTALHAAASGNHVEVIKLLLAKGAFIDILSDEGFSPLFAAINKNKLEAAKILLENKADPNLIINKFGDTLLVAAIKLNNLEMVKLLVNAGAKVYSDKYMDPLSLTARLELPEFHKILLEKYQEELKEKNANAPKCTYDPNSNDFEVVVTRYNEDISWLKDEFPCDKVTVYNKGEDDLDLLPYHYEIKTENVGLSEGTLFKYIVDHYHHLPNRVLFLQANPYDAYTYLPLARFKGDLPSACKNVIGKCDPNHNLERESIALQQFDFSTGINSKYKDFNHQENDLLSYAKHYLNTEIPQSHALCYATLLALDKEVILRHPIEYYQEFSNSINYTKRPVEAFYIERISDLIFQEPVNYDKYSPSGYCAVELPW